MLVSHGEGMQKKSKAKYPWELLSKNGDFFIWGKVEDGKSIRACGPSKGFKITVTAIIHDGKPCVLVTRVS